jgi:outer membrane protein assembly factor BamB
VEFLMNRSWLMLFFLGIPLVTGCGTPRHLSRDYDLLREVRRTSKIEVTGRPDSTSTFNGDLALHYEKKIKGAADSPILVRDGMVAFKTTRNRFLAFDQASGRKICQIKQRRGIVLDPVVYDSLLVLVKRSDYGEIQVINLYTGRVVSQRQIKEIRAGPIIIDNGLIIGTTDGLWAIGLPGLETLWRTGAREMVENIPATDAGMVYYTIGKGIVRAVRENTGEQVWESAFASPVISGFSTGRYLYFSLTDGRIMAVDTTDGKPVWEHSFAYAIRGGVVDNDGNVFFGSTDGNVYALSQVDGSIQWQYQTGGVITATPIIYGAAILIGSHDRYFYSLDSATGKIIDRHRVEGAITEAAAAADGRIFVACRKNRLYCFEGY